ncbi:hypothetical protein GCM10027347_52950 [Larkinella harenae]
METQKKSKPKKSVNPEVRKAIDRAMEFISEKGIGEVAERLGVSSASIYMVRNGKSHSFNFENLMLLAQSYPEMDIDYVLTGVAAKGNGSKSTDALPLIKRLQEENRQLKELLEATREAKDAYKDALDMKKSTSIPFHKVDEYDAGQQLIIEGMNYRGYYRPASQLFNRLIS